MKVFCLALVTLLVAVVGTALRDPTVWTPPSMTHGANVSVSLNAVLLEKAVEGLLPTINRIGNNFTVPAESTKHFSFDTFKLNNFGVGNFTAGFKPNPTTKFGAVVSIGLENLKITIPHTHFCVYTRILGIKASCCGEFYGEMSGTNIGLDLAIEENEHGGLSIAKATSTAHFGSLQIHHWFANFFCKIGQDIIQLFVGNIDNLITKIITQDLPAAVGPVLQDALNKALPDLPLKFDGQPLALDDSLTLRVNLLPYGPTAVAPVKLDRNDAVVSQPKRIGGRGGELVQAAGSEIVQEERAFVHRRLTPLGAIQQWRPLITDMDVSIEINDESINDLLLKTMPVQLNLTLPPALINTIAFEKSIPKLYQECPNSPLSLDVDMTKTAPWIVLQEARGGAINLIIRNMLLGFNAMNCPSGAVDVFDVQMNATGVVEGIYINQSTSPARLMFKLNVTTLYFGYDASIIPGVNVGELTKIMQWLVQSLLIPTFDSKFQGIPLPNFGKTLTGLKTVVTDHDLAFGVNLSLK